MGSGLSMASVNKIKELAEQREYSLALDIVDSQDLSKSLNPQFIRICGDIYMHNGRYVDARKMFLMAHKLAPEGKRVMYSLTYLYLKMGYMDLAKRYYDLYMFDADEANEETKQVKYIYGKAHKADLDELYALLCPFYIHNLDYDWSFETYLLLRKMGKDEEADILSEDYAATYKNSKNSEIIAELQKKKEHVDKYFDVFSHDDVPDEDFAQEELRTLEKVLLEADDLRVNPKEAEITIVVDDYEEVDIGTKRRFKKKLKNEEKEKKKSQEQGGEDSDSSEMNSESETLKENTVSENEDVEVQGKDVVIEPEFDEVVENTSKRSFFKKVFSKKKQNEDVDEDEETEEETVQESATEESIAEEKIDDSEHFEEQSQEDTTSVPEEIAEDGVESATAIDDSFGNEEDDSMQELHTNKHNPMVSIDFGSDDFAAESDTIDGLKDSEFTNPFDDISVFKKEKEEPVFVPKRKTEISFDDIDIDFSSEDDEEFEVDDFSFADEEFGLMEESEYVESAEDIETYTEETEEVETYEEPAEEVVEEDTYEEESYEEETLEELDDTETYTEEVEEVETYEEPAEEVVEEDTYEEKSYEEETLEELDDTETYIEDTKEVETYEEPAEEVAEEIEYVESTEDIVEETIDIESTEDIVEETIDVESTEDIVEETIDIESTEDIVEETIDVESTEDVVEDDIETESYTETLSYTKEEVDEEVEIDIPGEVVLEQPKSKLDYPVFRSSLFPNHNKEVKQVENNFNEIMTKGQDKIQENLLKEEQMQREAEALLASLGIDLSSITVSNNSMESINKTLYNEPSRDELKASLKIDSVKKDILKKIKEYR